jgi:FkbM family methyltransferase
VDGGERDADAAMSALARWRASVSRRVRQTILAHYLVPDSRFGLSSGLVPHLPQRVPVTLVDIGANRGNFAATIRAHCGLRSALLIEPQPDLAGGLSQRFPEQTVAIARVAVSDRSGRARLDVLEADSCSSLLPILPEAGFRDRGIDTRVRSQIDVEVVTVDELLYRHAWSGIIDVLKVDTQGTELQVLNGAERTLPLVRLLWIEVSFRRLYDGDAPFATVHERLSALGFRLYSLHEVFRSARRELLQADALFLGPQAE